METKEQYTTETAQNGTGAAPAAPNDAGEWFEADRISVQLVLAKKRGPRGVKVSEVNYMGPEQRPLELFADPDDAERPWGTALEKLIAQALAQAEQQGTAG